MGLMLRWLLRPWVLYIALGIAVIIFLIVFYGWIWVIHDAEIFVSYEGVMIYDARPKIKVSAQNFAEAARRSGEEVDRVYRFLRRCVPLLEGDEELMKEVSIVFISKETLQILGLLSLSPKAAAIYAEALSRIYVTESGDIAHEWIHHYLYKHHIAHKHHKENPLLEHPLFARCESYLIGPFFGILN